MITYANEKVNYTGCPSCAFSRHEFSLPCDLVYEDESFIISQDWELPIPGFLVIAPKRHIENFSELKDNERNKIFELINSTINVLKENKVCNFFNVIFEEKPNYHFHIWIMPRMEWMKQFGTTKNIGLIFDYAIKNMKTEKIFKEIKNINEIVKNKLKDLQI